MPTTTRTRTRTRTENRMNQHELDRIANRLEVCEYEPSEPKQSTEKRVRSKLLAWGVPDGPCLEYSWANLDRVPYKANKQVKELEKWQGKTRWSALIHGDAGFRLDPGVGVVQGGTYAGSGKTRLGISTLRRWAQRQVAIENRNSNASKGFEPTEENPTLILERMQSGLWISWPTFADVFLADRDAAEIWQACDVGLLIIDDIGAELRSEGRAKLLRRIIDHRYMRRLRTLVTTNYSPNGLDQFYGDSTLVGRLMESALVVPLFVDDYRPRVKG